MTSSTGAANLERDALGRSQRPSLVAVLRAYFASDPARMVQTLLGLIWLLDGALQFQSFMYSRGFLQLLLAGAAGQPAWLADSIDWAVRLANGDLRSSTRCLR